MKEGISSLKISTGKPTRKRLLGRSRRIWEENNKTDLKQNGISMRNWIDWDHYIDY